jgi:hypothetical protein
MMPDAVAAANRFMGPMCFVAIADLHWILVGLPPNPWTPRRAAKATGPARDALLRWQGPTDSADDVARPSSRMLSLRMRRPGAMDVVQWSTVPTSIVGVVERP